MKSQHHFEIQCEIEPREAAQIRTLIADLDRIVQVLTCALQLKRSARGFSIDPTLCMRSSPGRWQLAGTILGAPSLPLNSGSRRSKRPCSSQLRPSAPICEKQEDNQSSCGARAPLGGGTCGPKHMRR